MTFASDPTFRVLHALRIRGFSRLDGLAEQCGLPIEEVEAELIGLQARELAVYREARALWQLSAAVGRQAHASALEVDVGRAGFREGLQKDYPAFLDLNVAFKELCGDWQLRGGAPNDHSDEIYDREVIDRLMMLDGKVRPIATAMGKIAARFSSYAPRLEHSIRRLDAGEHNLFTGVMCGSYHDVWMELHEDLILTLGIDRGEEGSF